MRIDAIKPRHRQPAHRRHANLAALPVGPDEEHRRVLAFAIAEVAADVHVGEVFIRALRKANGAVELLQVERHGLDLDLLRLRAAPHRQLHLGARLRARDGAAQLIQGRAFLAIDADDHIELLKPGLLRWQFAEHARDHRRLRRIDLEVMRDRLVDLAESSADHRLRGGHRGLLRRLRWLRSLGRPRGARRVLLVEGLHLHAAGHRRLRARIRLRLRRRNHAAHADGEAMDDIAILAEHLDARVGHAGAIGRDILAVDLERDDGAVLDAHLIRRAIGVARGKRCGAARPPAAVLQRPKRGRCSEKTGEDDGGEKVLAKHGGPKSVECGALRVCVRVRVCVCVFRAKRVCIRRMRQRISSVRGRITTGASAPDSSTGTSRNISGTRRRSTIWRTTRISKPWPPPSSREPMIVGGATSP